MCDTSRLFYANIWGEIMRLSEYWRTVYDELSGQRAYTFAEHISNYNRVQLSNGYHQAAEYCVNVLDKFGVECRINDIPLYKGTSCFTQRGFDCWDCVHAVLRLSSPSPMLLCDYESDPLSLIQRSCPTDIRNAEIVMVNNDGNIDEPDITGKLIFIPNRAWESIARLAIKRGALGIITDYIPENFARQREDLPDERYFYSFYPLGDADEKPCFGFVITPRQGNMLKKLCIDMASAWHSKGSERYPRCDAHIEIKLAPGHAEIVEAWIPGETDEEIIITGHLCHPKPSANDNASGCAGAIEIMCTLDALIRSGRLAKPQRTIRMVLVPEVSGTFAYLAKREKSIKNIKAVINLDMIGRRQSGRSGMLGIMGPCDAVPSFIIDLMAYIRRITDSEAPSFNIDGWVTPFHSQILEYFGGSDHYVYCDPAVGIPSVTMMQWMDKNYHTSSDKIENLDSQMLKKSAAMAALWAYALSSLVIEDVPSIFALMQERFWEILHRALERPPVSGICYTKIFGYYLDVFRRASLDLRRFIDTDAADIIIEQNMATLSTLLDEAKKSIFAHPCAPHAVDSSILDMRMPKRDISVPISFVGETLGISAADELSELKSCFPGLYGYNSVDNFILFRINGKRTIAEIARLVGIESRFYNPDYVSRYVDFLAAHGVVHFV